MDVEPVLAVEVSRSMDIEELELQREGCIAALRDPEVIRAIQGGDPGRIAVFYFEWAGYRTRSVPGGRTPIDGPDIAAAFGEALQAAPVQAPSAPRSPAPSLSRAEHFENEGFDGCGASSTSPATGRTTPDPASWRRVMRRWRRRSPSMACP